MGYHTIIGHSAAALAAIRAIRRCGDTRPVVLISNEASYAYSPVLTTYYIGGQIKRAQMFLTDKAFYRQNDVKPILGHRVMSVDTVGRQIHMKGRKRLTYDNLLIASGASARRLDGVEPDAEVFVSTLRTIADAQRIRKASLSARTIVVLGAGLVSLQTIKAILARPLKILLVVGSQQVLSQQMDRENSRFIEARLIHAGVEILFDRRIDKVYRKGDGVCVVTDWGESLDADYVVVGKGVQPNCKMVADTPVQIDYGIRVDDRMRSSVEGIFAAGDVAEGINSLSGAHEVIATWFNACGQGDVAGRNMAGKTTLRRQQVRENITTLLGLVVASIGESHPPADRYETCRFEDEKSGEARTLYFDGGLIKGALLVGRTRDAGVIKHCIANQIDVSAWKPRLADTPLDFGRMIGGRDRIWQGREPETAHPGPGPAKGRRGVRKGARGASNTSVD